MSIFIVPLSNTNVVCVVKNIRNALTKKVKFMIQSCVVANL